MIQRTTLYEVVGWPNTCPDEKFSLDLYMTKEKAEAAIARAEGEFSDSSFEIETKSLVTD